MASVGFYILKFEKQKTQISIGNLFLKKKIPLLILHKNLCKLIQLVKNGLEAESG